ncbi:MAG TPA: diaminobutyrate--2-oxoglutarate transaminase, partial [Clostridia bacterium]|nr:diaminobutyrate--2-oxoglutarate transaminase [Clostridia bacterium]
MDTKIFETYESEVRSYCRKFPVVFTKAKGSFLTDADGRGYIDFFCGAGSCNYGHNNEYIKNKVIEYLQLDGIVHSLDMYAEAKGSFIEYVQQSILQPRGLDYKLMFPGPTGANSVEAALKLARKVKKRQNIFALMGCFHGMTLGSLALTTDAAARAGAGIPLGHVTHIPAPYMFPELDTIRYMDVILTDDHSGVDRPAALVVEAVQAEGGVHVLSAQWLQRARELCDRHDMLLIADEIQVGCARTGPFFAFERAGIKPDIVVMAKSIGGMGMPFALTLFRPELDIWQPGEHNGTFRGFQPAMVAARAGLEYMLVNSVEAETSRKGVLMEAALRAGLDRLGLDLPLRGIGMIWGVDFAAYPEGTAKKVSRACFERGLVIELAGRNDSVLKLM